MKVPLKKAIGIIVLSTLLISGSAFAVFLTFKFIHSQRAYDERYNILAIVQTSSEKESLKTAYFSELLNLSVDKPVNIYRFNKLLAEDQLLTSPLLKEAKIKKIYPGTIHIYYVLRLPVAFLADYTNTAIDKEGVAIPFKPFFTPKILPEIYLGLKEAPNDQFLGKPINLKETKLALKLLKYLSKTLVSDQSTLKRIDVSDAYASSYGQKQIIVVMEDKQEKMNQGAPVYSSHVRILRLSSNGYVAEIKNYLTLRKYLIEKERSSGKLNDSKVIDLRIPELAFIRE